MLNNIVILAYFSEDVKYKVLKYRIIIEFENEVNTVFIDIISHFDIGSL